MLRIFLYFLVSGFAALVNFISRFLYDIFMNFWLSIVFAYFTGMLVNYLLSRKYVFSSYAGGTIKKTSVKFATVATIGLGVTTVVSLLAHDFIKANFDLSEDISKGAAHALGIAIAFFASYLGHNFFTFRNSGISKLLKRNKS